MRISFFFSLGLFILSTFSVFAAESVRVGVRNGVPQILADGQPLRARMFFGNPGTKPLIINAGEQRISFEFQPLESEPSQATVHFRLPQKPAVYYFDAFQLDQLREDGTVEKTVLGPDRFSNGLPDFEKNWQYWPTGTVNTCGSISVEPGTSTLRVQIQKPDNGVYPDFHFYHKPNIALDGTKKYRMSFWVKSEEPAELRIAFYRPGSRFTYLGGAGKDFFRSQIEMAGKAGAQFVSFSVGLPWAEPGKETDFDEVDAACQRVLAANPDALLIPRIPMDPPVWWIAANPNDVITWKGQPNEGRKVAAVSSAKYLAEASERLAALVRHLEAAFPGNMAGYHPCGQNTGEWFYQDSWGPALNGYAPADTAAFRTWLERRYQEDVVLQKKWGNPSVTLARAEVPAPELRLSKTGGVFRDIAVEKEQQAVLDFVEFQQEMMADTVTKFAAAVRKASNGKRLVVFFYGYGFEFGALQTGPATSGHYALRQVLECPDIDILCSPISYFDRKIGGSAPAMSAAESVALAGKLWLYEDDTRTHLTPKPFTFPGGIDGADTQEQTLQLLRRNTAQCAVRHFGTWWMDLGTAAWFDDPKLWDEMKKLETLDKMFLQDAEPFQPEVALFLDESSMLAVAAGGQMMSAPAVYQIREPLARMGTPYAQYLLDDFGKEHIKARLNVFASAWRLPKQQRELLRTQSQKNGMVNIWCYAPGFLDTEIGGAVQHIEELTGFKVKPLENVHAWAEPTENGKKRGLQNGYGIKQPLKPLFAVTDAQPEEVLAAYSDGSAAVVMRQNSNGSVSIFSGVPGVNTQLLRLAALKARVHLFTTRDCNVYANGTAVVVHAAEDGETIIRFNRRGTIIDLMNGTTLANGSSVILRLKTGETRIFKVTHEF